MKRWEMAKEDYIGKKECRTMAEEKQVIVNVGTEHIHPHPENPRKDLGDLSELAESLKKNGCLQNLTVVPIEGQPGEYYALIGNRRHGASKLAGIKELPCRIVEGMSQREQLSTMLEENMQRNDLTIYEQAQGFQLMLDLGETEDSIAEKTGFSKTTIRHRLNIAKLDQKKIKKKEKDECFQLTMKDYIELEKVADIKTRNKILEESTSSRDLISRVQGAISEAKRKKNEKIIYDLLKKKGLEKAPKEVEDNFWGGKYQVVKEFSLDNDPPRQIQLPKSEGVMYYFTRYRDVKIVTKAPKKKVLSEYEIKQKEVEKRKKQIKAVLKESTARRKEFIQNIISGKIGPVKDEEKAMKSIWEALVELGSSVYSSTLRDFFLEKDYYKSSEEERAEAQKKAEELGILHQMMIILHNSMANINEPFNYNLEFIEKKGHALQKGYEALEPYGWYFEKEEEKEVLNGTFSQYKKNETKEGENGE